MCNVETEGTKFGCGHYVSTKTVRKIDCGNQFCMHSSQHAQRCPHCPGCERYLGPDARETITLFSNDYCTNCEYWLRGPGSRPLQRR